MNHIVRFVGSAVISLILVSIPGLFVASVAFEWDGFMKTLLCFAMVVEYVVTMYLINEGNEE